MSLIVIKLVVAQQGGNWVENQRDLSSSPSMGKTSEVLCQQGEVPRHLQSTAKMLLSKLLLPNAHIGYYYKMLTWLYPAFVLMQLGYAAIVIRQILLNISGLLIAVTALHFLSQCFFQDLLAVGYGNFDFTHHKPGLVCCWSIKNTKVGFCFNFYT